MSESVSYTEQTTRRKQYAAPALTKGLEILELMSDRSKPMTLKEIAGELKRSKGEIFRMVIALEEKEYLSLVPDTDKYIITMKLFELAHKYPKVKRLTTIAGPIIEKLCSEVYQSCHLAIPQGGQGMVVVQQDSPADQRFGVSLGIDVPLYNTCSGHILLAFSSPEKLSRMLSLQPAKHRKVFKKKELAAIQDRVKKQGYELIPSQQVQGVTDIGFPIFDYSGEITATLVIPFLEYLDGTHPLNLQEAKSRLCEAANQISKALGYGNTSS